MTNFTLKIDPAAAYDYLMWIGNEWGPGIDNITQRTAQYMFVLNMNLETSFNRLPVGRNYPNVIISKGHTIVRGNNFTGYANTFSSSYAGEYGDLSNNDFYTINVNVGLSTYITYENNFISRNPYAAVNEDPAQGIWGRANAYYANNYVENTGQPTSNDGEILAVESYRGGTKIYGGVTAAASTTLTLDPMKKPDGSLRGSAGINNMDIIKRAYGEWQVLIVRGRGLGQLRKITALDQSTKVLTVDRPWDILPDQSSKFAIYIPNKGVIIYNNTVVNGAKGLWLYGQNYDGAIVGNTGMNVEGAYINAVQGDDRLDTNYFHRLENNTFIGGGNKNGLSGVGVRAELNAGGTFGYIVYGISEKGNTVQHVTDPAVKKDATEAPNISGIYAVYESRVQQAEIKTVMKAVTIEKNTVNDVDRGITLGWGHVANAFSNYPFSSGVMVKDNILKNVGVKLVDQGTSDTTYITPISKEVNLAFNQAADSSSAQGENTAGKAVDGDLGTAWTSAGAEAQWISVDMGRVNAIQSVHLDWGSSYASQYKVQVSNDADQWTDAVTATAGDGGADDIQLEGVAGRYVRIYAEQSSGSGYSLKEFEVMGIPSPVLVKASTNLDGNKILLTFDKSIAALPASPAGFTVEAQLNGVPVAADITAAGLNSDNRIVELTLAEALVYGTAIQLSYTPGAVQTVDGGLLNAFSRQQVSSLIPAPPVALPAGANLIVNPGFENGPANWFSLSGGVLTLDTGTKKSGAASGKVDGRTQVYHGQAQDITAKLYNSGPGTYLTSAWAKLASGSDNVTVALRIEATGHQGFKYFNLATGTAGTSFAELSGTTDITWTGVLTTATLYVQTKTSLGALNVDDVSMVKAANSALLTPSAVSFDKKTDNQTDVSTSITWNDATRITDIKNGGTSVGTGNYSVSGNTLTILKSYLAAQPAGNLALTVEFDHGNPATLNVTIFQTILTEPSVNQISQLSTTARSYGVAVIDHYAYVADRDRVRIVDIANPASPVEVKTIATAGAATTSIAASGNYIYFVDAKSGGKRLYAYNVADPLNPVESSSSLAVATSARLQIVGTRLYAFDGGGGVRIIDISVPGTITQRSSFKPDNATVNTGLVGGNELYVTTATKKFMVYNVTNAAAASLIGSLDMTGTVYDGSYVGAAKAGNYVYLGEGSSGNGKLIIMDVSNPAAPVGAGIYATTLRPQDIITQGDYAMVAYYTNKFELLDIKNRTAPVLSKSLTLTDSLFDLEQVGEYVYGANSTKGLLVMKISLPDPVPVATSIQASSDTVDLKAGQSQTVTATVYDQYNQPMSLPVAWSSDNAGVASVNNGTITGTGAGSTIVRAVYGALSANVNVAVASVPTVGTNLVKNPGFEDGKALWEEYGGTITVVSDGNIHSGSNGARFTGRTQAYHGPRQSILEDLKMTGPGKYYVSAWYKIASPTVTSAPLKAVIEYKFNDNNGVLQTRYPAVAAIASNSEYGQISGFVDLAWQGEPAFAKLELQSAETTAPFVDLFVDDVTVMKVDVAVLNDAVESAAQLHQHDYTQDTWTAFADALSAAEAKLATGAPQTELDAAWAALQAARASLAIAPPVASFLEVNPAAIVVTAGQSQTVTAAVYDQSHQVMNGLPITWISDNPDVAVVNNSGLITGASAGSTMVRAVYGSLSAAVAVTVGPAESVIATLTGVDQVDVGETYTLIYGLNAARNVSAQDVSLSYDSQIFELLDATPLAANTVIADTYGNIPGLIRYKLATSFRASRRRRQ